MAKRDLYGDNGIKCISLRLVGRTRLVLATGSMTLVPGLSSIVTTAVAVVDNPPIATTDNHLLTPHASANSLSHTDPPLSNPLSVSEISRFGVETQYMPYHHGVPIRCP